MDKDAFVQSYGKVVARAWTDDAYMTQLQTDPTAALDAEGFDLPADVKVAVGVVEPTGNGSVDSQYEEFTQGAASGGVTLWIPEKPDSLAGASTADDTSCTCTPCSTCT